MVGKEEKRLHAKPIKNCNMFDYGASAGRWEDITERCYGSTPIKKTHVAFILAKTHAVSYIFHEARKSAFVLVIGCGSENFRSHFEL